MKKVISEYNTVSDYFSYHHYVSVNLDGNSITRSESHGQFEILYLLSGNLKYFIEGEEYKVEKGDVIFVPPNEVHSLQILAGEDYERIVVMFSLEKIEQILESSGMKLDGEIFSNLQDFRVVPREMLAESEIKNLMFEIAKSKRSKNQALYFFSKVLSLVLELEKIVKKGDGKALPVSTDKTVQSAINYINENITSPLSLDQIAEAIFVSKSSLCHKFSECMKVPVNKYVTIKKVYYADKLIKDGLSATDAALVVGYKEYTAFYHNYRKIFGVSPRANR